MRKNHFVFLRSGRAMPSIRRECRFIAKGSFAAGQGLGHVDVAGPDTFVCVQDVKLGKNTHRRIRVVWADAVQLVPPVRLS